MSLASDLLSAHSAGDAPQLARLYAQASSEASTSEAAGFYMTHAYVFALEAGLSEAETYRAALMRMGRI